jgi:hypothetical protein
VCDAADEHCGHSDVDHGMRHVQSRLIVSHEAAVAGHPAEGSLYDASSWEHDEGGFCPLDDFDSEVEKGGFLE